MRSQHQTQIGNREEAVIATYRALQDIYLGGNWPYAQAGSILIDGPGGNIPPNWQPPPCVDPLDADGVQRFWNAANNGGMFLGGFGSLGLVRQQWTNQYVAPPVTFFVPVPGTVNPNRLYRLVGLGVGLPPVLGCS